MAPTAASLRNLKPFKPGHTKVGGARKGSVHLLTASFREFLEICKADPAYREQFLEDWRKGKKPHVETIITRAEVGDPTQNVEAKIQVEVLGFRPPTGA